MPNTTKHGGPPCPQLERLEELMEFLTEQKYEPGDEYNTFRVNGELVPAEKYNETLQEAITALDWLHTSLSNRKTYQKKQQIKKKVYLQLAKEILSTEELKQVEKQVEEQLQQVVANEA